MKKAVSAALSVPLFVYTAGAGAGVAFQRDEKERQHAASHRIVLRSADENDERSATAVAPNVLLTAHHCDIVGAVLYIDDDPAPHKIARRVADCHDTMLLVLADRPFLRWVYFTRPPYYRSAAQGEKVYWFGNPYGHRDIYREGYFVGIFPSYSEGDVPKGIVYLAVAPTWPGDSGAAVWDTNGRLLGVVTYGFAGNAVMGYYSIAFTAQELQQAGL